MAEGRISLSGAERAAILLMSIGENDAAEVLKLMTPKEVQKVGSVMATLNNVSKRTVGQVLEDFAVAVEEQTNLGIGNENYVRKVLVSALGEEKASGLIDNIFLGRASKGLEALRWMDPRAIAEVIRHEHPQIIAIVLGYLDSDHAAEVLGFLPERMRPEILMRVASLDGIQPQALQELDEIIKRQFQGTPNLKSSSVGGLRNAADILNFMDVSAGSRLLEQIKESDPEVSDRIGDLMFVFDNLVDVDDRGIQALLREVSSDMLILAMKGAGEAAKEKIFSNMSKRAGEMLREDLEAKGPVRLSEVEAAQKDVLAIARRMAEAGDIVLNGKGQEQYV